MLERIKRHLYSISIKFSFVFVQGILHMFESYRYPSIFMFARVLFSWVEFTVYCILPSYIFDKSSSWSSIEFFLSLRQQPLYVYSRVLFCFCEL